MKLVNEQLEKRFKEVGEQDTEDPIIIAKFFNPTGAGTWYAVSYSSKDKIFFGYVSIFGDDNDEWGSFSLKELENLEIGYGLGIERDLYFKEKKFSEVIK